MLSLAFRILAIAACLYGIAECAHISKEVLKDHVDNPPNSFEPLSKEPTTRKNALKSKQMLDPSLGTNLTAKENPAAILVELAMTFVKIMDGTLKRPFLMSASAQRMRKYAHWTASRTQIHPAIA
ncbi:hypothetical protein A1O1_00185 [Capronia coronata CBS 617.96]|uniref:Uncharacterized protein n=1 Tax=Capronia coronata CBS 617.96 TaxID=1182541 RepID=W9YQ64_9EURO|nr:uncharacterized protein A1O1_00185 [Capronia coronata CBS 617.96]EXJ95067.1 hypothetical protein A1O1_00185 [Capronia coronata CBS 617.96]